MHVHTYTEPILKKAPNFCSWEKRPQKSVHTYLPIMYVHECIFVAKYSCRNIFLDSIAIQDAKESKHIANPVTCPSGLEFTTEMKNKILQWFFKIGVQFFFAFVALLLRCT